MPTWMLIGALQFRCDDVSRPLCGAITSSLLYTYYFDGGDKINSSAISPLDVETMAPMIDQAIDDVMSELMTGAVAEQEKSAPPAPPANATDAAVDEILQSA